MASGEGVWGREGLCARQGQGRGSLRWGRWARGVWLGSAHLDIFCGPQLIGGLHLLLGNRRLVFHNYSGAFCLPSHLSYLEGSQWSAQSPWGPLYIPVPRGPHPHALWGQQVSSPANGGPGWALTSQSPILTCLAEDGEQFRWFAGRNEAFVMPLPKINKLIKKKRKCVLI